MKIYLKYIVSQNIQTQTQLGSDSSEVFPYVLILCWKKRGGRNHSSAHPIIQHTNPGTLFPNLSEDLTVKYCSKVSCYQDLLFSKIYHRALTRMPRSSIRNRRKKSTPVSFEEKQIWGFSWCFSVLMSRAILKFPSAL